MVLNKPHITLWFKKHVDPENNMFLVETNLPTPTTGRVYVNLLEGNIWIHLGYIDGIHVTIYIAAPLGSVMGYELYRIVLL